MTTTEALPASLPIAPAGSSLLEAGARSASTRPRVERARPEPRPHATRGLASIRPSLQIARLASWIVWALPSQVRSGLARFGGWLFYRFSQTYRENVKDNLRQILGPGASPRA